LRVLLVEDNAGDVELVRVRLRDSPGDVHTVLHAETLEEGFAELTRAAPDVALLDMNLSDSEGLDTVHRMRSASPDLPIVVLTGISDLDTAVSALREGADDYVAKLELLREGALLRPIRYAIERRRMHADLERAVRAREELLQVVSHDVRNHINTIELGVRLLRSNPARTDLPRRLDAIDRAATISLRLLDDLVDLAALESGHLVVNAVEVDIAPIVAETAVAFAAAAEQRRVRIEVAVDDAHLWARADAVRVTQVLGNLVANALKFTPVGGLITLGSSERSGAIVTSVTDTGPGVPPDDRGRLFERFFRGSTASGKGAGLGLAIARALIEAQGGSIWLDNDGGAGATFAFSLPKLPIRVDACVEGAESDGISKPKRAATIGSAASPAVP
jgi:signal transduction histidine kinase